MSSPNFELKIDGCAEDARGIMCHYQADPYPGGHRYDFVIRDLDVVASAANKFGMGSGLKPDVTKASSFLSLLYPLIGMKLGRLSTISYWLNTIDHLNISENEIVFEGTCSPHVSGEVNAA